jgi:hypothetical protein
MTTGDLFDGMRPATAAHLKLTAAVLHCLEAGVEADSVRRFVEEELPPVAAPRDQESSEGSPMTDRESEQGFRDSEGSGAPLVGGCQKPDACEWKWWPEHCQCPNAEGSRVDAPEPPAMVAQNARGAKEDADRRVAAVEERLRFATDHIRKLELAGAPLVEGEGPKTFAELRDRFIDPEKEQLRAELKRFRDNCSHRDTTLNGDGTMTCDLCGFTEADPFSVRPDKEDKPEDRPPSLHGHNRTLRDVREWIAERKASERKDAPTDQHTPAFGMTMGALETLDALSRYLNGDDDA